MVRPVHAALAGLLLASLSAPAFAEEPAAPAEGGPPAGVAAMPPATPVDPLAGPRHALALGWHGATFWSQAGSQYTFHSAALSYLGSSGRSGAFVHATLGLPLQARQDGRAVNVSTYYNRAMALDLLLGWQWRRALDGGAELEAGPGLHADLLLLLAKEGYFDFTALHLGLGGEATATWPTPWRLFGRPLRLGAVSSVAVDLWDPLRDDDLRVGLTLRAALVATLGRE